MLQFFYFIFCAYLIPEIKTVIIKIYYIYFIKILNKK